MVMGWAIGKFGLFGIEKTLIADSLFNYVGVMVALFSVVFVSRVEVELEPSPSPSLEVLVEPPPASTLDANGGSVVNKAPGFQLDRFIQKLQPLQLVSDGGDDGDGDGDSDERGVVKVFVDSDVVGFEDGDGDGNSIGDDDGDGDGDGIGDGDGDGL